MEVFNEAWNKRCVNRELSFMAIVQIKNFFERNRVKIMTGGLLGIFMCINKFS